MAAERIDLFHSDCVKLTTGSGFNDKRINSECQRLSKWLQKHQEETVTDGAKTKLVSVVQEYYKIGLREVSVRDAVYALVDDYLKLPEGKLVTSKAKQSCLRWLDALNGANNAGDGVSASTTTKYMVADIDEHGKLLLMSPNPNSEEFIEDYEVRNSDTGRKIKICFEECGYVSVEVDESNEIVAAFKEDGTSLL